MQESVNVVLCRKYIGSKNSPKILGCCPTSPTLCPTQGNMGLHGEGAGPVGPSNPWWSLYFARDSPARLNFHWSNLITWQLPAHPWGQQGKPAVKSGPLKSFFVDLQSHLLPWNRMSETAGKVRYLSKSSHVLFLACFTGQITLKDRLAPKQTWGYLTAVPSFRCSRSLANRYTSQK